MAGLWSVRKCRPIRTVHALSTPALARLALRLPVRSSPAIGGAVPWLLRGSARCAGSSGLGDTATFIPAGGGPVREATSASRTVRVSTPPRPAQACTERVHLPLRSAYLAE